jgi:anti-sigma B factor antagonist
MRTDDGESADTPATLTIRLEQLRPGVQMIHVGGRLDQATAPALRSLIAEQLEASPWAILLDLTAVSALETSGIATLICTATWAAQADIGLYVVMPDGELRQTLRSAGVYELFEIHPTAEAAMSAFPRR